MLDNIFASILEAAVKCDVPKAYKLLQHGISHASVKALTHWLNDRVVLHVTIAYKLHHHDIMTTVGLFTYRQYVIYIYIRIVGLFTYRQYVIYIDIHVPFVRA